MAEAEGKRGPGRPKMLASRGIALPIRLQEPHFPPNTWGRAQSVITSTSNHRWRGSGRNEYPFMKKSPQIANWAVWGLFWKANLLTCMTSWFRWGPKWKTVKCTMKPLHKFLSNRISLPPGLLDYVGFFYSMNFDLTWALPTDTEVNWHWSAVSSFVHFT